MVEITYDKWKEEDYDIVSKDVFLNGTNYEEVNPTQQMLYLQYKKIEQLESRIITLEELVKAQAELMELSKE